jgi:hypothetical protein
VRGSKAEAVQEDVAAPPISVCVVCGLSTCAGCARVSEALRTALPWEDSKRGWVVRLWETALATSLEPQRFFGELPSGRVAPALGFAVVAESCALGSVALLVAAGLALGAPEFTAQLLASSDARWAFSGLWLGSVLLMVVLHTLWGLCLDAGAGRRTPTQSWAQGLRFGLYACGWDLLTSPIGALSALLTRGPFAAWAPIGAAARAPRLAQRAYLEGCRSASDEARRRAARLSLGVVGGALATLGLGLLWALFCLARHFGY